MSTSERLGEASTSSNNKELKRLEEIIGNETKAIDNIKFSEKNKSLQGTEGIDNILDKFFDNYMVYDKEKIKGIVDSNASPKQKRDEIQKSFRDFVKQIEKGTITEESERVKDNPALKESIVTFKAVAKQLEKNKDLLERTNLDLYNLELQNLKDEVLVSTLDPYQNLKDEVLVSTLDPYQNSSLSYRNEQDRKRFKTTETNGKTEKIADIYSNKRKSTRVVLDALFDKDDEAQLKSGDFRVNLGIENGIARIILDIQEKKGDILPDFPLSVSLASNNGFFTAKEVRELVTGIESSYKKEGMFRDYGKIAKLFNTVTWGDLINFADLMKARPNVDRLVKERYNNKNIIESEGVTTDNVFEFLVDINSDGYLSASADKKEKKQFKYGDLGNLTGQQLLFTIQQVEKTKGEASVVRNIVRMIILISKEMGKQVPDTSSLRKNPTKAELVQFLMDNPQAKGMFLAAIEKISGGSLVQQADLYDVLAGEEGKRFLEVDKKPVEEKVRKNVEDTLETEMAKDENLKATVNAHGGVIEVRENIMQRIMRFVDGLKITIVDKAMDQGMIMSGVSKDFYKEQAKRTILEDFTVNNISLSGSIKNQELKLGYTLGKNGVSETGKTKRHIAGGPAFYVGKNRIGGGLDINFSQMNQFNYAKTTSASLSDVQKAKYLGIEGGAGAKIAKGGKGLYAYLGPAYEKDPVMGIIQLEKAYQAISNILFDVKGLENFSKENIKNHLEANLNTLQEGDYKKFVDNNKNKLSEDIRLALEYISSLNMLSQLEELKTPEEKQKALSSLLRMVQQGNIDQWKGDIIMNLHGKLDLTRFSGGIGASTWFFGTKPESGQNTGTSTSGGSTENPGGKNNPPIEAEGGEGIAPSNSRGFYMFGAYVSARVSTWKAKYFENGNQIAFTKQEISKGVSDEIDFGKDLDKYANYLEGVFNKPGLSVKKVEGANQLVISYTGDQSLSKILKIYYKEGKEKQFRLEGNTLTIGNVGPIAAYTIALPKGVERIISLGTKNIGEAKLLEQNTNTSSSTSETPAEPLKDIEFTGEGLKALSKPKLDEAIDGLKNLSPEEKTFYKGLFDQEGKLQKATEQITYGTNVTEGQSFTTGTLLLSLSGGKYTVDYVSEPQETFNLRFRKGEKVAEGTRNILKQEKKIRLSQELQDTKAYESIPKLENNRLDDYLAALEYIHPNEFNLFLGAITKGNTELAAQSLIKMLRAKRFEKLVAILKDPSKIEERQYIVDSFVSLLAYETVYPGMKINTLYNSRDKARRTNSNAHFLRYQGPGQVDFAPELKTELLEKRNKAVEAIANERYESLARVTPENIFGYTAFYRKAQVNRGYAATAFGRTNVVESSVSEIENQEFGKNWIAENISKDEKHAEMLVKQIKKTLNDPALESMITVESVKELLGKGELLIENKDKSKNTLDISNKKLKLEAKAIFYLLGECVNESVGLRIEGLSIEEDVSQKQLEDQAQLQPDPQHDPFLYVRNHSISGKPEATRQDYSTEFFKGLKSGNIPGKGKSTSGGNEEDPGGKEIPEEEPEPEDPETPDPETPDPETPDPETPDPETPDPETPEGTGTSGSGGNTEAPGNPPASDGNQGPGTSDTGNTTNPPIPDGGE